MTPFSCRAILGLKGSIKFGFESTQGPQCLMVPVTRLQSSSASRTWVPSHLLSPLSWVMCSELNRVGIPLLHEILLGSSNI